MKIYYAAAVVFVLMGIALPVPAKQQPAGYPAPTIAPALPPRKIDDGGLPPIAVDDPYNEEDPGRTPANMLTSAQIRAMLDNEESAFWEAARRDAIKADALKRGPARRGINEVVMGRGQEGYRSGRKLVALTFDDGPHTATTLSILEILRKHRVPATFFFVGTMAERHPELVRAAFKDGHSVGNHSFHHVTMGRLPDADAVTEIKACGFALQAATGVSPHLFRPPGGQYNSRIVEGAAGLGYHTILWTCDPEDYLRRKPEAIASRILKTITPGGIVILHSGVPETVRALPLLIRSLRKAGYDFVTVDALLNARKP